MHIYSHGYVFPHSKRNTEKDLTKKMVFVGERGHGKKGKTESRPSLSVFCSMCVTCLQNDHQFFPSLSGWPQNVALLFLPLKSKVCNSRPWIRTCYLHCFSQWCRSKCEENRRLKTTRACCWEPLCTAWESLSSLPGGGETRLKETSASQPSKQGPRTHQWGHPTGSGANWSCPQNHDKE